MTGQLKCANIGRVNVACARPARGPPVAPGQMAQREEQSMGRLWKCGARPVPAALLALVFAVSVAGQATAQEGSERGELAPTGTFRLGLVFNNRNIASRDPATGELRGVGVDLGRELAERLDLRFEPIGYRTGPDAVDGLQTGAVDAVILGVDPARGFDFAPPYIQDDMTYIVPAASPMRTAADADRPGVRIAATPGSSFYLALQREVHNAEVVGIDRSEVWGPLETGTVDAHAFSRSGLLADAAQRPGLRVVEGRFGVELDAIALPKGRPAALAFVTQVMEEAKASGLVQEAIERAGLAGLVEVPPSADNVP
jgi:polar amino acid transport system substrate-binding protein